MKLFTSFIFLSLKINKAEALSLTIGAKTLYFCVDNSTEMALCLPLVKRLCKILEYLTNLGSSAKSSMTINIECKFFLLVLLLVVNNLMLCLYDFV